MFEPLNLEKIFVNYFAGDLKYFFGIALIFFAYLGATYRIPTTPFIMIMVLFITLMSFYTSIAIGLLALVVMIVAFVVYWLLSKTMNQ